jgi:hypothetical protein
MTFLLDYVVLLHLFVQQNEYILLHCYDTYGYSLVYEAYTVYGLL